MDSRYSGVVSNAPRWLAESVVGRLVCGVLLLASSGFSWPGRVERLVAELHHEDDPARRTDLVKLLTSLASHDAEAALTEACSDKNASVRSEAVSGLARLADPPLDVIRSLLTDGATPVRAAAASALALAGDKDSHERLIRSLGDEEPLVRAASARALAALKVHKASGALGAALSDPSSEVAISAAEALCQLGGSEAELVIASRFASLPGEVQGALLEALTQASAELAQRPANAALASAQPELVRAGLQLVVRHRLFGSLPAVQALRAAHEPSVARAAELAQRVLRAPAAQPPPERAWLPALIESARRDLQEDELERVLERLERLLPEGEQLSGDPLAEWLPRAPARFAARVARLLARSQARVRGEPLLALLDRQDSALCVALCAVLANSNDASLAPRLLPRLGDADLAVRMAAARALGTLADAALGLQLAQQLADLDELPRVQQPRVAQALALAAPRLAKHWSAGEHRRVQRALGEALDTDDEETAAYVARALALVDPAAASALLRKRGSTLSAARRVALLRASAGDTSAGARQLRAQYVRAPEPAVAATALTAQLLAGRAYAPRDLLTMLTSVRWPLGPIAAFGLNRSHAALGSDVDQAALCAALRDAREPLTRRNLRVALASSRAKCASARDLDDALVTVVQRSTTHTQAATTFRALVLADQSVLVSATDAAGDASWPLMHARAERSAWSLPYRSNR